MEKEEFVDKLFIALQRLSSGAQKRVLEDMRRLNSSILCKEHRVYDVNKEKPIARYGRPICEMLLRKLSKSKCVPLEDDINWSITKGKRKNDIEVRRALKHLMVFAASYYLETKDKEFMECFLNTLNSNQDSLVKSTAPIMYKSNTPGNKLNVGKRTATSKNIKDKGFTKEHNIPTKFIYDAIKKAVFNDKVIEMFDLIMKDNFQVLLNSDDDEKLNKAGLRSKMPEGWKFGDDPFARYVKGGIDLNSLKKV